MTADDEPSDACSPTVPVLPPLTEQAERLIATGVLDGDDSKLTGDELRDVAADLAHRAAAGALLVVSDHALPVRILVPQLTRAYDGQEKPGFIVVDMDDVADFVPTVEAPVPDAVIYAIDDPRRGDDMRNWTPAEAQEALCRDERTPFTIGEGVHWALQLHEVIDRNACYMMIGSRRPKTKGFDSRTPALWISNGTGRDGRDRRGAPKLGWCWWNNRHTWLGFASGARRVS
ncbi:MAG TPA: hypothetical protein IAA98_06845 [Candidatus Avipropionibacterium avicola]|uniref:Uncharacterized protein n=1 Tax=Candidatus Avipropionibacterium avicola TaxID=2840701 RepID=A0A9D1GYG4_9ACTN|nr:hypothetical protein [Candidatus Avipropionibacterium avicola]